jgi:hypothetical protein
MILGRWNSPRDGISWEGLLKSRDDVIRLSEEIEADGDRLYFAACYHGLEGIEVSPVFGTGRGMSRGRDPFPMSARHGALIDTLGAIDMIALPSPGSLPTFQNNERMTNATTNSIDMIDSQFGRRVKPPTLVG